MNIRASLYVWLRGGFQCRESLEPDASFTWCVYHILTKVFFLVEGPLAAGPFEERHRSLQSLSAQSEGFGTNVSISLVLLEFQSQDHQG